MNTNPKWILSLISGVPREVVVEAVYFAVRQLKQASMPANHRKDHFADASRSEASPNGRQLAAQIISVIQGQESSAIESIPATILGGYIDQLTSVVREVSLATPIDPNHAGELLKRLRAM